MLPMRPTIPPQDILEATRQRYEATKGDQQKTKALIEAGKRYEADSPEQRTIRRERLMRDPLVRSAIAATPEISNTKVRGQSPLESAATLPVDVYERVIGSASFLGVAFLSIGLRAARTVACLHVSNGARATGFMVSPELLLTNNHVFPSFASAQGSQAFFNFELDENNQKRTAVIFDVNPERFFLNDPTLDYALVAIDPTSANQSLSAFGFNPLSSAMGKVQEAEKVNIIQHPSGAMKQIVLQDNDISKRLDNFIQYVADTMPGSSGAPVYNNQWEVIALHHSGVPDIFPDGPNQGKYRTPSGDVWQPQMGEDGIKWIANEGVRISSILADLQTKLAGLPAEQQAIANVLLQTSAGTEPARPAPNESDATPTPQPANIPPLVQPSVGQQSTLPIIASSTPIPPPVASPFPPTPQLLTSSGSGAGNGGEGVVSISVPIEITLRLGSPATSVPLTVVDSRSVAVSPDGLERVIIGHDYEYRDGYQPDFLSCVSVPLPRLTPAQEADAALNRRPVVGQPSYVLPYYHFSVVMNKRRKVAFYTAGCVSGELSKRFDLGKREGDAWIQDERIGADEQTGARNYRNALIDKGHLTRRLDNAWGDTFDATLMANNDTFHYTNCSPQHAQFNRNRETWQGLENYVLDKLAKDRRLLVFNGPIFRDDDPVLDGVQVPMDFWKIVVFCRDGGQVTAGGFRVPQGDLIRDLLNESFQPAQFQVNIAWIISESGLDFTHLLPYDRFAQTQGPLESTDTRTIVNLTDTIF